MNKEKQGVVQTTLFVFAIIQIFILKDSDYGKTETQTTY